MSDATVAAQPPAPAAAAERNGSAELHLPSHVDPGISPAPSEGESTSPAANKPEGGGDKDDRLASRFAALAKKDRALREEKKRLERERAELAKWGEAERLAKEDPLALLQRLGLSYQDLTDRQLAALDAERAAKDPARRIETVEERLARIEKLERDWVEAERQRKIDAEVAAFQGEIEKRIAGEPDRFELVIAGRAHGDVFRLIEAHFNETGELLPVDQAAQLVEDQLLEEAQSFAKAKKLRALLGPKADEQNGGDPPARESEGRRSPEQTERRLVDGDEESRPRGVTLTNGATAAAAAGLPKVHLDLEESKRRAAALLKWT